MLPTFTTKGNATFQLGVSENKGIIFVLFKLIDPNARHSFQRVAKFKFNPRNIVRKIGACILIREN